MTLYPPPGSLTSSIAQSNPVGYSLHKIVLQGNVLLHRGQLGQISSHGPAILLGSKPRERLQRDEVARVTRDKPVRGVVRTFQGGGDRVEPC